MSSTFTNRENRGTVPSQGWVRMIYMSFSMGCGLKLKGPAASVSSLPTESPHISPPIPTCCPPSCSPDCTEETDAQFRAHLQSVSPEPINNHGPFQQQKLPQKKQANNPWKDHDLSFSIASIFYVYCCTIYICLLTVLLVIQEYIR